MRAPFVTVVCASSLLLCLSASGCGSSPAKDVDEDLPIPLAQGLSPTPPMGWNSWNAFKNNISEKLIQQIADAMVDKGMKDVGYQYINIDDTWSTRDPSGAARPAAPDGPLVPDAAKFPNGMKAVADYVHDKGLKLGIYGDRGFETCGHYPGSEDHEVQDATTFAEWGIDYLKYDNCPAPAPDSATLQARYGKMADALAAAGHPIVYSLCAWSFYEWGIGMGQLWRTTSDITPNWTSIMANLQTNRAVAAYAGPNGWNDPDMLEVGNFGLPEEETEAMLTEYRSHFTLWAMMAAPLILGNDPRGAQMSDAVRDILTNPEVIALDQDAFGYQGVQVRADGDLSVWAKPLNESGARAVVLLNGSGAPADISVSLAEIGLRDGSATVRDLWAHADRGSFQGSYTATAIPSHGVAALKVTGQEPARPSGAQVFLSEMDAIYAANGLGPIEKDTSNGATAPGDGHPQSIRQTGYAKGLGVAAPSSVVYRLGKRCTTFSAQVGVDDDANGSGSVVFQVWADGDKLFDSGTLTGTMPAMPVQVDVTGKMRLKLVVTNAGDGAALDRADWADAQLACP